MIRDFKNPELSIAEDSIINIYVKNILKHESNSKLRHLFHLIRRYSLKKVNLHVQE